MASVVLEERLHPGWDALRPHRVSVGKSGSITPRLRSQARRDRQADLVATSVSFGRTVGARSCRCQLRIARAAHVARPLYPRGRCVGDLRPAVFKQRGDRGLVEYQVGRCRGDPRDEVGNLASR
jgi:hypothetical protein